MLPLLLIKEWFIQRAETAMIGQIIGFFEDNLIWILALAIVVWFLWNRQRKRQVAARPTYGYPRR